MKSTSLLLFVAAVFAFHGSARAGPYSLEIVAEVGDVIDGRTIIQFSRDPTMVRINNDGEIAFYAKVSSPEGEGWSVMTQNRFIAGAGKLVDGRLPFFNDEDHGVAINNLGQVTYSAFLPEGGRGLFVDETLLVQPGDVIDGITLARIGRNPAINDHGTVAFQGGNAEFVAGWSIFTQDRLVVEDGRVYDGHAMTSFQLPHINNAGEIVFRAAVTLVGTDALLAPDRIIAIAGDTIHGRPVAQINDSAGITDGGDVVFTIVREDGKLGLSVVTEDRVLFETPGELDGIPLLSIWGGNVAINNDLEFAFLGQFNREDGTPQRILFADGERIIADGDVIDGKVIRRLRTNFDINDHGDVVFRAEFEDLSRAVILARAIPEPDSLMLAALALIAFLCIGQRRLQRAARHHVRHREEV
ncbi:MAG: PEP-CTERM sorting domain-containing protein [Planctomycetes bacterium]|nr:PEP-CTERM sorting domain-containing protein [Planctomycetota bacterium]